MNNCLSKAFSKSMYITLAYWLIEKEFKINCLKKIKVVTVDLLRWKPYSQGTRVFLKCVAKLKLSIGFRKDRDILGSIEIKDLGRLFETNDLSPFLKNELINLYFQIKKKEPLFKKALKTKVIQGKIIHKQGCKNIGKRSSGSIKVF